MRTTYDPQALPTKAQERARAWLAEDGDTAAAPEPRSSAAVILLRDTADGLPMCLMVRQHAMATAGGVPVFPGGMLDPQDDDAPWAAAEPEAWATALQLPRTEAVRVVNAAARELFEETSVLLAAPLTAGAEAPQVSPGHGRRSERADLEAHRTTFADVLRGHGLGIRADLLRLWSTWVTPTFEARRFRNSFFVAALPSGQSPSDGSSESVELIWRRPHEACLSLELLGHADTASVLRSAEALPREVVEPTLAMNDGVPSLRLPNHLVEHALSWAARPTTPPSG